MGVAGTVCTVLLMVVCFPMVIVLSPFGLMLSYDALYNFCNTVSMARIEDVRHVDALQCVIDVSLYDDLDHHGIMHLEAVPCMEVLPIWRKCTRKHDVCNVTVAYNKWYGAESCIRLIESEAGLYAVADFKTNLQIFIVSIVCVAILFCIMLAVGIMEYTGNITRSNMIRTRSTRNLAQDQQMLFA